MKNTIHGAGLGLRSQHFGEIIEKKPNVPWFELLADNYISNNQSTDSIIFNNLKKLTNNYPMALHCVGMSLGSVGGVNKAYLENLKKLIEFTNPVFVSDHLSWGNIGGFNSHELLPLPYTEESLDNIVKNIKLTQEFLNRNILVENVSSYISYKYSNIKEWEFLNLVSKNTGCKLLLDINNIYVNSVNHKFDPKKYIKNINPDFVEYFHIAGHEKYYKNNEFLIDTHGADICEDVFELFKYALKHIGKRPCLLERDNNIPSFDILNKEREVVSKILENTREAIYA